MPTVNPQDLSRYSYVRNNPVRYTDPTGHCPGGICIPGWAESYLEATSGGRLRTELHRAGSIYAHPGNALNTVETTITLDDDDGTEVPGTLWLVDSCPSGEGCTPLPRGFVIIAAMILTYSCIIASGGICAAGIPTVTTVLAIGATEGVTNHALHAQDTERNTDGYLWAGVSGAATASLSLWIPGPAIADDTAALLRSTHAKPTTLWEVLTRWLWLP